MQKRAAANRSDYVRLICKYVEKREKSRHLPIEQYLKISNGITAKLKVWRKAVKRIDEVSLEIKIINTVLMANYGISMYKTTMNWKDNKGIERKRLLRKMFCKYLMDKGIGGNSVSSFVGWKDLRTASYERKHLAGKIQSNEIINAEWQRFKKKMQLPQQQRA